MSRLRDIDESDFATGRTAGQGDCLRAVYRHHLPVSHSGAGMLFGGVGGFFQRLDGLDQSGVFRRFRIPHIHISPQSRKGVAGGISVFGQGIERGNEIFVRTPFKVFGNI